MRLYTFTNYYLSSIQVGIQTAHVVSELFVKYPNELYDVNTPDWMLVDWGKNHKTIVCLNGGNNADLQLVWEILHSYGEVLQLPVSKFHEDDQSLGGIITCVGIVVPDHIYEYASIIRATTSHIDALQTYESKYGTIPAASEVGLAEYLNLFNLAR